jgi:hypothetical protein
MIQVFGPIPARSSSRNDGAGLAWYQVTSSLRLVEYTRSQCVLVSTADPPGRSDLRREHIPADRKRVNCDAGDTDAVSLHQGKRAAYVIEARQ